MCLVDLNTISSLDILKPDFHPSQMGIGKSKEGWHSECKQTDRGRTGLSLYGISNFTRSSVGALKLRWLCLAAIAHLAQAMVSTTITSKGRYWNQVVVHRTISVTGECTQRGRNQKRAGRRKTYSPHNGEILQRWASTRKHRCLPPNDFEWTHGKNSCGLGQWLDITL